MRKLVLTRIYEDTTRTLGYLSVFDEWVEVCRLACLELPWRENRRNVSRIPEGRYRVTPEYTARLGFVLRLHDVPDRDGILFHAGNYTRNTEGCILCGIRFVDLDADGKFDIGNSQAAMTKLQACVCEDATLIVVNAI